jgi:hypothetical protein
MDYGKKFVKNKKMGALAGFDYIPAFWDNNHVVQPKLQDILKSGNFTFCHSIFCRYLISFG